MVAGYRRFRGAYCLHLQGNRVPEDTWGRFSQKDNSLPDHIISFLKTVIFIIKKHQWLRSLGYTNHLKLLVHLKTRPQMKEWHSTLLLPRQIQMILKSITNSVMKGRNLYKQNNQTVPLCTKIRFSLLFHHLLFSNKQILLLILRYEEVQNLIQQDKHIYITTVFHTDLVTNSIYKLDAVFPYTPHLEDHSDYHSTLMISFWY